MAEPDDLPLLRPSQIASHLRQLQKSLRDQREKMRMQMQQLHIQAQTQIQTQIKEYVIRAEDKMETRFNIAEFNLEARLANGNIRNCEMNLHPLLKPDNQMISNFPWTLGMLCLFSDDQVIALLKEWELPDTGNKKEKIERFGRFIGVHIDTVANKDDKDDNH